MKILMVCLGNICRSPLAEGILADKAKKAGFSWLIESAGTGGYHIGEPPHSLSQKVALLNGIDISKQQCRQFRKEDMVSFDRIFVMDNDNYHEVKRISMEVWDEKKVSFLLDELYPGEKREVPDPWYGGEEGFHEVFKMIEQCCDRIIEKAKEGK